MLCDLSHVWNNEKEMLVVSGLTLKEAEYVLSDFSDEVKRIRRKDPNSKVGRPPKLSEKKIFLMLMLFMRHYQTLTLLGVMFGVDASTVKRWVDDGLEAMVKILVKKNFRHLIVVTPEALSETNLTDSEKSTLMALSSLLEGQKTI